MVKKIRCKIDSNDWVSSDVSGTGKNVRVKMEFDDVCRTVILTPADARKLRKQIKKALEAIGGVNEEEAPKEESNFPDWFQAGAIVEITGNSNDHHFRIGEKVRVGEDEGDDGDSIRCDYLDGHDYWFIQPSDCKPA